MTRQLNELTKEELIDIIQDYQEIVSEIEDYLNRIVDQNQTHVASIRKILYQKLGIQ